VSGELGGTAWSSVNPCDRAKPRQPSLVCIKNGSHAVSSRRYRLANGPVAAPARDPAHCVLSSRFRHECSGSKPSLATPVTPTCLCGNEIQIQWAHVSPHPWRNPAGTQWASPAPLLLLLQLAMASRTSTCTPAPVAASATAPPAPPAPQGSKRTPTAPSVTRSSRRSPHRRRLRRRAPSPARPRQPRPRPRQPRPRPRRRHRRRR
jgi:hypothetical protein